MKITGVSVAQTEEGRSVSVTALFANNEEMEDADIQRVLDAARELGGDAGGTSRRGADAGDKPVSRDPKDDGAPRRRRSVEPEGDQDTGEPPRRRQRASSDAQEDATPRARNSASESRTATRSGRHTDEDAEERPTSRRRSAASEDAEEQPSRSRGRNQTSEGRSRGAENTDTSDEDEAPRRRGKDEPKKISDEDLMKACSATSRVTSSRTVLKIVEQFGVGEVSKIPQAERQEFLDLCKEARDKAAD